MVEEVGGRDGEIMIWRKWDVVVGDVEVVDGGVGGVGGV